MNKTRAGRYRRVAWRTLYIALAGGAAGTALAADPSVTSPAPAPAPEAAPQKAPPVPLAVFGDNLPAPGKLVISVIPTFFDNAHVQVGTNNVTPQQVVTFNRWYWNPSTLLTVVPQEQFGKMQTVTLAYGLMKDWSVVLTAGTIQRLSYLNVFGTGPGFGAGNIIQRGTSNPGTDTIADVSASLVWRAYEDPIHRVKVNLGMAFPTGSNHNIGGAVMQTTGTYAINEAFYGMQPGTGTFDVLPGILYGGHLDAWSWGLSYRARLGLGMNPEGYRWGNYQEFNGWFGYTWIPGVTTTFRTNFNIQSQISGADWWLFGKLPSANPLWYGGKRIEVYGGIDIDGKLFGLPGLSVGFEGGVPVYQNLNGPQLAKNWMAGMALRWRVGEEEEEHRTEVAGIFKGPKTAPDAPPRSPWTGAHVGVSAGFTTSADNNSDFIYGGSGGYAALYGSGGLPSNVSLNSRGFIGGVQFGYDRVFCDKYLAGIEADLSGITSGAANWAAWSGNPLTYTQAGRNVPYLGTARGRAGYLVTPAILAYATGGLAWGETDLRATYFSPSLRPVLYQGGSWLGYDDMRLGWTAGAGVEWLVLPRVSVKGEYLYYDLGTANTANVGALYYANKSGLSGVMHTGTFDGHVFRLGVNYHFNGASAEPVVAKY
ncbi:outer membrane protein [Methylocystis heyeri]|uniref:Outer membrane beta-barrel protein n=1 Tax=Methylocystis heyeri TaxID=391905 RepID=A0A6B8KD02_9HYPH|nr:outer membrane beta-barrel protein [Methylocystis heyeri]QGM46294.1 outer membrane beta-barrel protein [Methylocystis heyeri]